MIFNKKQGNIYIGAFLRLPILVEVAQLQLVIAETSSPRLDFWL